MNNSAGVTFIVKGQRLPANRDILAARSEYFRALLYGGLAESTQHDIKLEVPLEAFQCILSYIKSGFLSLSQMAQMKDENILDTLGLANMYGFAELESAISEYLRQILSFENVCAILDAARLYSLDTLMNLCYTFMDRNATAMLVHECFKNLSQESLCRLLKRDSFFAPEVLIFGAVSNWCKFNQATDIESVVSEVRFPLMNLEQLLKVVRPSGILSPERLLDAIEEKTTSKTLPYRRALWHEENVAAPRFGSRTIGGAQSPELLEDKHGFYDMEKGYTRHTITDSNDSGIVVELGTICVINHVKMLLWDKDNRSYSYFIEVSVDRKQWDRVVDYHEYYCRSWQYLYFNARAVRYIKLVGTHSTENKVFDVVSLNAKYTETVPTLINGIISPDDNIATVEFGASVVKGICRVKNNLITAKIANCSFLGCTSHQIGNGEILIQLGQPYLIGSLKFCMYNLVASRESSYYIETSLNCKDWEMFVDRRGERCKSWQQCFFESRPVSFIKILGTFTSTTEFFSIIRFECPALT